MEATVMMGITPLQPKKIRASNLTVLDSCAVNVVEMMFFVCDIMTLICGESRRKIATKKPQA
jgi:hypothetical protein